jgi:hypothetical protein
MLSPGAVACHPAPGPNPEKEPAVGVGSRLPVTPSTDPDERNYRIRLLPQVITPTRQRHRHRHAYLLQLTRRVRSALCPGRVLLGQVPLGQSPSLHLLRHRLPGLFGNFLGTTELSDFLYPCIVGVRPWDFPDAACDLSAPGGHRISRFSSKVFRYMLGVSDLAGPVRILR